MTFPSAATLSFIPALHEGVRVHTLDIHTPDMRIRGQMCVCVCLFTRVHMHAHAHACTHAHTRTHARAHTHVLLCTLLQFANKILISRILHTIWPSLKLTNACRMGKDMVWDRTLAQDWIRDRSICNILPRQILHKHICAQCPNRTSASRDSCRRHLSAMIREKNGPEPCWFIYVWTCQGCRGGQQTEHCRSPHTSHSVPSSNRHYMSYQQEYNGHCYWRCRSQYTSCCISCCDNWPYSQRNNYPNGCLLLAPFILLGTGSVGRAQRQGS